MSATYRFHQLSPREKAQIQRANGTRSCTECSRLKLKCDRKLPACGSCVRRRCEFLCPNGSSGQRTREKRASKSTPDTDRLTLRIQELEDALAIFQSSVSSDPHPLLRDDLLKIKYGSIPQSPESDSGNHDELSAALGTLTIGQNGDAKYFGPSAGHEMLFQAGAEIGSINYGSPCMSALGFGAVMLQESFPWSCHENQLSFETLLTGLPTKNRAWTLTETYFEQGAWHGCFIDREELINEVLTPVYSFHTNAGLLPLAQDFSAHRLAALFFIFAIGALVDLTIPPDSDEADQYFRFGRGALSLHAIFTSPELATVQALNLMALYHLQGGRRYSVDAAWTFISLATKRSQSIGLHRESPQWKLDKQTLERRRLLFWGTYVQDAFISLSLGRPPSTTLNLADCQFPDDDEEVIDENGESQPGRARWIWMFAKEVLSTIVERTLSATSSSYSAVLELDRRLREFSFPHYLRVNLNGVASDEDTTPGPYMRKHILTQVRFSAGLYVHRSFFAKALLQFGHDPMGSPYCDSFLASYRCSCAIIALNVKSFTVPHLFPLLMRWWPIWGSLFSAAMVVASIVIHCPGSSIASKAYIELGVAIALFEKGAEHSAKALSGLVILRRLMDKATKMFSGGQHELIPPQHLDGLDELGDELEIFAGHTKVLVSKLLSSRRQFSPPPSSSGSFQQDDNLVKPTTLASTQDMMSEWLMDPSVFVDDSHAIYFDQTCADEQTAPGLNEQWLSFMEHSGFLHQDEQALSDR